MTILERWRAVKPVVAILALCLCSCASIHGPQRYTYSLKYQWMTEEIYQICVTESARNELPLSLVLAVIDAESSGRTNAVSKAGALGLMQVMPKYWYDGDPMDLHIPRVNIQRGCAVLRWAHDLAKGDIVLTLRNFERGPRGKGINVAYTRRILKNLEAL
ncbi:MAG TPA: transglycosylase SLT domain-containing protein [Dissulfurispiraceae bacterium]|nr:transglycosylase SLT domain-containing protein [Dissulfurispiraceae bacterium]